MNKLIPHALAVAVSIAFSAGAMAQSLSNDAYKAAKQGIASDYAAAKSACASQSGNAKDICRAEAKGKEGIARAELDERRSPSAQNRYAVSVAKAKAAHSVAREKCDDLSAGDKAACVKDAKAAEARATAQAKAEMNTGHAAAPAAPAKPAVAATSKKESPQEYVDDSVITGKVKAAIFEESTLKSAEINVETYKGIVQLSGFVSSRTAIDKAVQVARGVRGVTSVKNVMIVKGQQ